MISIITSTANNTYGLCHYLIDEESDIQQLSTDRKPGSLAIVPNGAVYVLNNNKQWIKKISSGEGSSVIVDDDNLEEISSTFIQDLFNNNN